jgi:hypothetical protein
MFAEFLYYSEWFGTIDECLRRWGDSSLRLEATIMSSPLEHWNSIFEVKQHDVSWWQDTDQLWLDLIQPLISAPSDHIVDVGAGTSLLLETLAKNGQTHLTAVDISQIALDKLQKRAGDQGFTIETTQSDMSNLQLKSPADIWHDRAVFHFMTTTESQSAYKQSLLNNLAIGGRAAIATFALDGPEQCSGLDVQRWDADGLQDFFGPELEMISHGSRQHVTPWDSNQSFVWVQLRRTS